jgi:HEAT repeat protein
MPVTVEEIHELFRRTLDGDYDDDGPWDAVHVLRRIGSRDVFDVAAQWCEADDPLKRARGADVIAQLGKTFEHPSNSFPHEAFTVISRMLRKETEIRPLASGIFAFGHLDDSSAVPFILRYEAHADPEVRYAVACALGSYPNDPDAIKTLAKLTADQDEDVRDWAAFGLGCSATQIQLRFGRPLRLGFPARMKTRVKKPLWRWPNAMIGGCCRLYFKCSARQNPAREPLRLLRSC